jgi:hypothetical protein
VLRRRYRFVRDILGCGVITSAFIALLNEASDLPPHKVGFMFYVWDMTDATDRKQ